MRTIWNLNKKCDEAFVVMDDVLQRVLSILEMSEGSRNYQSLTQSEVLNFVGW